MLEFQWDEANTDHIARHNVTPAEVEQVLLNENVIDSDEQIVDDELRLVWIGETTRGRILQVVFTERDGAIRPVTAYPPDPSQRRKYLQAKADTA